MTSTATASRHARRLIAGCLAALLGLAPAAAVQAQRGPAESPDAARPPAARTAPSAPAASPAPAASDRAKPSDILVDRPDIDPALLGQLLGDEYESKGQGIALRPPKDSVPVRRPGAADFIEFVNPDKGWTLKISKIKLQADGSLTQVRDRQGNLQPGMLEHTATRLKEELPDAEFLRQEKIRIGAGPVGMLVLRHSRNLKPLLSQQAILERNLREYYLIALTTPGAGKGAQDAGPGERLAVETFSQILDSVRLLDGEDLRAEQDARLFATRSVMLRFKPDRIRAALVKERWTRVLKNGKDVGYAIIRERVPSARDRREGVEIAIRSRMLPNPGLQVDSGSIMYATMDMRHEDWRTLTEYVNVKQRDAQKDYTPPQIAEFGVSDRRSVPGHADDYTLSVIFESTQEQVEPVTRPLPPFYLPQAFAHLLPRLLPLNEPKAFLFTSWVPESREVILRYVDVRDSKRVDFNGELVRCVPVEERIGLEGSVTTHYVSHDGQWLGSENKDAGIKVVPTTEEALKKLWKDVVLDDPEVPARDRLQASGPPSPANDDAAANDVAAPRRANSPRPNDAEADAPRATPRVGERRGTGTRERKRD